MPAAEAPPEIGCHCGQVRLAATAGPVSVVNCHCGQCRRLSGAAFTTWASVKRTALPLTGAEPVQAYAVTANVTRHFCGRCGAHVFTTDLRLPGIMGVPAGAITSGHLPAPNAHYFVDDAAPWQPLPDDGLPRFGGESGSTPWPD